MATDVISVHFTAEVSFQGKESEKIQKRRDKGKKRKKMNTTKT